MTGLRCTSTDLWTVAQTCYGEARGEGLAGMTAVAWVIRNRHDVHPRWHNTPLVAICRAPMQFSCWNPGDPNLNMIRVVNLDNPIFVECLQVTVEVVGGMILSPVGEATHYYNPALVLHMPVWAEGKQPVAKIGDTLFFEGIA